MSQELANYRVLVVEDEYFLAADIEYALLDAGAEVIGPVPSVEGALKEVRLDGFDLAVLDNNLGGNLANTVADALADRNDPFGFASAYISDQIPARHRTRALIQTSRCQQPDPGARRTGPAS